MTSEKLTGYKRMAWLGLTLGAILLLLGLKMGFKIVVRNLLLVYLIDAIIISGLMSIILGVVGVVAYATNRLQQ